MSHYLQRKSKAARERGKRMAARRWQLDRERRERLAKITADQYPSKIIRRIIVIENETVAKEAVIWSWDSRRSAQAKLNRVLFA